MERPSFYAIIPAHVRYSKDLEPAAKLLYGEITALCSSEGYCWASNQYFAELYSVHITTVQEWIRSLKENGFIKVEVEVQGIQRKRKIWISPEIKKMFTKQEKSGDVIGKILPRHRKNPASINTESNTDNKEPPTPKGELRAFGKFVKLYEEDLQPFIAQHGKEAIMELIEEINDYLASTGNKPYKDYAATIRSWVRRRKKEPSKNHQPATEKNKELAIKVCQKLKRNDIEPSADGIRFINHGAGADFYIAYKELGFYDQVIARLRKMGISVEGL